MGLISFIENNKPAKPKPEGAPAEAAVETDSAAAPEAPKRGRPKKGEGSAAEE